MRIALLISIFISAANLYSQPLLHPFNLDFEDGSPGRLPTGWHLPSVSEKKGYKTYLTDLSPHQGRYCAEIFRDVFAEESDDNYGSLMQSIDAKPYRGKRITFRGAVRAELTGERSSAHLWVHVRLAPDESALLDYMEDNPIVINTWNYYEITVEVHEFAEIINYGLMLRGSGKAWLDDASFAAVEEGKAADLAPPAKINNIGLDNLTAFAKLYGYMRFFNPSDESSAVDWDLFAAAGAKICENLQNTNELKRNLQELFEPTAPTLQILMGDSLLQNQIAPAPANAMQDFAAAKVVSGVFTTEESHAFFSAVMNIYEAKRAREASVMQVIDAKLFRGKRVRFSSAIRCRPANPAGQAQLWFRIDDNENKMIANVTMDDNPVREDKWKKYSIDVEVPNNAKVVRLGLVLLGDGAAVFDDVKLSIIGAKSEPIEINIKNPDFEEIARTGDLIQGWYVAPGIKRAGYSANLTSLEPFSGNNSLLIYSDTSSMIRFPEPGEYYSAPIGQGLTANYQIALFSNGEQTIPSGDVKALRKKVADASIRSLSGSDRFTRLGAVIIAWNIIRQFHLYPIDESKMEDALRNALSKAAIDKDENEFLLTLQSLISILEDSQSRVWRGHEITRYGLPVLWKWSDGKLLITQTSPNHNINAGDEVVEIEKTPVEQYLSGIEKFIPGATPQWKRVRALADLRAGRENSELALTIKPVNGEPYDTKLQRNTLISELTENRPPALYEVDSAIVYIDMTRVKDEEFRLIAQELDKAQGIIFDARGNSMISEYMLGYFIDKPIKSIEWKIPIYTKPDKMMISHKSIGGLIRNLKTRLNTKVVFLADERSAGYTEAVLKIAKNNQIAEIVGMPTAGTIGEFAAIRLPAGYTFTMTALFGYDADGNLIQKAGIEPTKRVLLNPKALSAGADEILETAIALIKKK